MRDIGRRIRRYRLSRYAPPVDRVRRSMRWALCLAALWLVWIGVISDHSLLRIGRLLLANAAADRKLAANTRELEHLRSVSRDPNGLVESEAREQHNMARPGEIIYRISDDRPAPAP